MKWGFNATKLVVILSARLGNFAKVKAQMQKLIGMMGQMSRNDIEEAITDILDGVGKYMARKPKEAMEVYFMTREAVKTGNETLWFKVSLRLAKIYLDQGDFQALDELIARLKLNCRTKKQDGD